MKIDAIAVIFAAAACLVLPAAVVPRLSLEQLAQESPKIVYGRVLDSHTSSSGQFIWTHYRVEVLESWKGNPAPEIVVSEPGGTWNGVTMEISGAVQFRPGEELVLFLYKTPIGYWRTTGFWQGKFNVKEASGEKRVRSNLRQAALVELGKTPKQVRLESYDGFGLNEFKTLVRELAKR